MMLQSEMETFPSVFLEAHNIQNRNKGLGVFNFELIKAMSDVNTDFCIYLNMSEKGLMKHFPSPLMKFHRYRSWQRHPLFRIRKRVDIWHSLNQNIKIEPYRNPKYVLTIHDVIGNNEGSEGHRRLCEKINRADAITYISQFVQTEVHQRFRIPQGIAEYVIHNGNPITELLDTSDFRPIEAARSPYLYAIGDFQERKNFHSLVQMMRLEKDLKLIISGQNKSEYAHRISQMIADNNLTDRVFITGVVSEQGKQYYLQNATAFLFPSTDEGFGLPIVEAMKFGKPVFLSPLSCLPEIGGADAYYFRSFAPEDMHRQLHEGLNHYFAHRAEVEHKMRSRAEMFTWHNAARSYLNVYRNLL